MPELVAALIGVTSLAMVMTSGLLIIKWGMTVTEMTDASRQRFIGIGLSLLALGTVFCLSAFGMMVALLTKRL